MSAFLKRLALPVLCLFLVQYASAQQAAKPHVGLNHIALYVQNLETTTRFYRDLIQLDTIPEPFHDGRHTWFSVGPLSHLHLMQGAAKTVLHDKNMHICFSVPSVEAFVARLKKAGIGFENWPGEKNAITTRVDGVKQVYLQDPDGFWVEVNDARR